MIKPGWPSTFFCVCRPWRLNRSRFSLFPALFFGPIRYVGRMASSLDTGRQIIKDMVATLPDAPGVYRMLNAGGDALYVGKARSLKKRVVNYTQTARLPHRLQRMVAETVRMEIVQTGTEVEALLMEADLIKSLRPRYNVLLRDDKSFPYILITGNHPYPLMTKHRGAHTEKGDYFGPFASAGAVARTLVSLQRAFLLRNCTDSMFAQRQRPCLQYHIKRCSAPCVNFVSREEYAAQVKDAEDVLSGKSRVVQQRLAEQMMQASDALNYELAARFRDRIKALTTIQSAQDIHVGDVEDGDVLALAVKEGRACITIFFIRQGQNFGNASFFPQVSEEDTAASILSAFIAQFYGDKGAPPLLLTNGPVEESDWLAESLSAISKRKVKITHAQRGERARLVAFAERNALAEMGRTIAKAKSDTLLLKGVANVLHLRAPPKRIEVYDNSHISGTNMVGAMVVAGPEGFMRKAYRTFNIKDAKAGDDFGMMREVLTRRFRRALTEYEDDDAQWPDLILIDGGLGQLHAAQAILAELALQEKVQVASIAKGPKRNAGEEILYLPDHPPVQLTKQDPVLHYLQRIRDEAHRFAIGTHRRKRQIEQEKSPLDALPGIGAKRKKALLLHFGSGRAVSNASIAELSRIEGISPLLAAKIYAYFHDLPMTK